MQKKITELSLSIPKIEQYYTNTIIMHNIKKGKPSLIECQQMLTKFSKLVCSPSENPPSAATISKQKYMLQDEKINTHLCKDDLGQKLD